MGFERRTLPVSEIDPTRDLRVKSRSVSDLVQSMHTVGQLHPVVVVPRGDRYALRAGHRRFAAAKRLRWERIEALVFDDESTADIAAVYENMARRDLPSGVQADEIKRLSELRAGVAVEPIPEQAPREPVAPKQSKQLTLPATGPGLTRAECAMLAAQVALDLAYGVYDDAPEGRAAWATAQKKLQEAST